MAAVRETKLPGVGVKLEFTTEDGRHVGVLVRRDGRREILVYDDDDPDACSSSLGLSAADTRTMSELLGASPVTEAVTAVQQQIEGLAIEWIEIPGDSATIGTSIADRQFRTKRDRRSSPSSATATRRLRLGPSSSSPVVTSPSPSAPSRASPPCAIVMRH